VINRDPENIDDVLQKMERGEIPRTESPEDLSPISYDEEKKQFEEDRVAGAGAEVERGQELQIETVGLTERRNSLARQADGEGHIIATAKGGVTEGEESGDSPIPDREQVPGDKTQWREGNDLIIERRVGPGEDVR
jgi:hypothetical protein